MIAFAAAVAGALIPLCCKSDGVSRLVEGDGLPECKAYRDALDALPADRVSGACGPWFEEAGSGISAAVWEDFYASTLVHLDAERRRYLASKIDYYFWNRDLNPIIGLDWALALKFRGTASERNDAYVAYRSRFREAIDQGRGISDRLVARIDIDNDGAPDVVYKHACLSNAYGSGILVLKPDLSGVDRTRSEAALIHHPFRTADGPLIDGNGEVRPGSGVDQDYDLVSYRGKTYLHKWTWTSHTQPRQGAGVLYSITGPTSKKVCELVYTTGVSKSR